MIVLYGLIKLGGDIMIKNLKNLILETKEHMKIRNIELELFKKDVKQEQSLITDKHNKKIYTLNNKTSNYSK